MHDDDGGGGRRRELAAAASTEVEAEAEAEGIVCQSPRRGVRRPRRAPRTPLPPPGHQPQALLWQPRLRGDSPTPPAPLPTRPPAAFLLFASRPARPGRGPPRCRPPWQRRPARGKSSPGISCGLAWFRLLPPRLRRLPAPQPHSGPPCLSCDRTDTAGGLEWNKLKVKWVCVCVCVYWKDGLRRGQPRDGTRLGRGRSRNERTSGWPERFRGEARRRNRRPGAWCGGDWEVGQGRQDWATRWSAAGLGIGTQHWQL